MAAFASGILSHVSASAQSLTNLTSNSSPPAAAADSSSTSSTSSATITANDFLTLLVTEMKNQDPTADTDPNEYINQLVNVNSLQQLIQINETLSSSLDTTSSAGVTGVSQTPTADATQSSSASQKQTQSSAAQSSVSNSTANGNFDALTTALKVAPGNLSIPKANPAAQSVAHALYGNSHAQSIAGGRH